MAALEVLLGTPAIAANIRDGKTHLIDSIIETPGIDLAYLGVYDICQSLGIPGQLDNPLLVSTLRDCVAKIRARGMAAGSFARDEATVKMFKAAGVQFIAYMCDAAGLADYYMRSITMLRNA